MTSTDRPDQHSSLDARDGLLWIVARWPALAAKLTPGGGNAQNGCVSTSGDAPLPIDVNVSDVMFDVEENARTWAWMLLDDLPARHGCQGACHGSTEHTCAGHYCANVDQPNVSADRCPSVALAVTTSVMPELLTQVAWRHGHFTADPRMALEFTDTATDLREKVRKIVEVHEAPTYLGPCRTPECTGELYASDGKMAGTCRVCSQPWTVAEQRVWLDEQMDARLMTQAELVRALKVLGTPVEFPTIRQWVKRGQLVADADGLYRLADAKALKDRQRKPIAA